MKNKKGTIILSVILAVQFIIPLSVWSYESYKNKELEEKGQEVYVLIDRAAYDENRVEFHIIEEEAFLYSDYEYIVFENDENGFSTLKSVKTIPETDLYVSENKLYSFFKYDWCFKYESEITKAQDKYGYFDLYDREIEQANIRHGFCDGPETQAYAVFKVYKNRFEIVNVYINSIPVDTVIEKYNNYEWDNARYDYYYSDDEDYEIYYDDESADYYKEYYDEELDEYVTEPYAY